MQRYTYTISLLSIFLLPTLIAWWHVRTQIDYVIFALFITHVTILGSIWDIWASRHGSRDRLWIWQFSTHHTLGIRIFDVPIEEYVFYTTTSAYVVLLWEAMKYGHSTGDINSLILLFCLALWSCACMIASYRMWGYR